MSTIGYTATQERQRAGHHRQGSRQEGRILKVVPVEERHVRLIVEA
jgi:hypothetical protein